MENSVRNLLQKNRPEKGLVQSLLVTEKQYVNMDFIVGQRQSEFIDSEERVVVL